MVAVMQPVKMSEMETFLVQVEKKFRDLLKQSSDPKAEIAAAAERMEAEGLLGQAPDPSATPLQAAFQMIGDNESLSEIWQEVQSANLWPAAETPSELISALLPSHATLD